MFSHSKSHSHSSYIAKTPRSWLTRASSAQAGPPVRISAPRLRSDSVGLSCKDQRILGQGAIIVRTPLDALTHDIDDVVDIRKNGASKSAEELPSWKTRDLPSPPMSKRNTHYSSSSYSSTSNYIPPVPAIPPPPFAALLVSPPPQSSLTDPSQVLVSLETASATLRTTLTTLTSRPSHLSTYLLALFPPPELESESEFLSPRSSISSLPPPPPSGSSTTPFSPLLHPPKPYSPPLHLHVFLDRPSQPYASLLAYLRAPSTPLSHSLLTPDLHTEARFLGLDTLAAACAPRQLRSLKSAGTLRTFVEDEPEEIPMSPPLSFPFPPPLPKARGPVALDPCPPTGWL